MTNTPSSHKTADLWKKDFEFWLTNNMYINKSTADLIIRHVEHYFYKPESGSAGWVKADNPPKENGYYICWCGDEPGLIHFHKDTGWQNGFYNDKVTHYLKLIPPDESGSQRQGEAVELTEDQALHYFREGYKYYRLLSTALIYDVAAEETMLDGFKKLTKPTPDSLRVSQAKQYHQQIEEKDREISELKRQLEKYEKRII